MKTIETRIKIDAPAQTVWSIMDDLENYPAWNRLTADLSGRTTVGSVVRGTLTKGGGSPAVPLSPTLTAIVGAREFRWLTNVPGFHAEHYFLLRPTEDGGTELIHGEDFDGPIADERWPGIEATSPPAFSQLNDDLKSRAEALRSVAVTLHPAIDSGIAFPAEKAARVMLVCRCSIDPVTVDISRPIYHNHMCGCSKCWKPDGALLAQTAVVSSHGVRIESKADKLEVIDESQSIQRHACRDCGVHMCGTISDPDHHFYGLTFVHPELADGIVCDAPEFAGFVSSIIETGTDPASMAAVRSRLSELSIPAFDAFSPELMDIIAWHKRKLAHHPQATE